MLHLRHGEDNLFLFSLRTNRIKPAQCVKGTEYSRTVVVAQKYDTFDQ